MKISPLALASSLLLVSCGKEPPKQSAQPQRQESFVQRTVPEFDGKSAYACLTAQTDFGPRNPGSTGHDRCLQYLRDELSRYADGLSTQSFSEPGYNGETLKLTNIIASFNLKSTTRILLIAHWDTRPRSDQDKDPKKAAKPLLGANDGASGVAVLLEIARHLKNDPPAVGVDLLLVDGEDYGKESDTPKYLLGSRYFAKHLPEGFAPAFGILLDMVGDKQLELRKEQYSEKYAPDVVDLVWSTARELGVQQFVFERQFAVTDDHLPLNDAGIKTIDLIDFNYPDDSNRFWHTSEDTPDKCSPESLEAVGKVLLHVIYNYNA